MNQSHSKKIVYMSMFITLEVILTRFLSIQTPIVRIGFTFIPIAISAIMFGPIPSGISAALADIVGMMLFSTGGSFFPGFTLTAFLTGVIYGIFLYKKTISPIQIILAVITSTVVVTLGLDTLWLWMLTGKGVHVILPARIIKCVIMAPIQVIMIQMMWRLVIGRLDLNYL
jgi:ECF transporter S component (folate family)